MTLPRYPAYKDSGVEWLGEVPEHWEVRRLRDLGTVTNGFPFDSSRFDPVEGIPLVRIRDICSGETVVRWGGEPVAAAEIGDGDVLIGMDGDFNVAWWSGGYAMLNQRVCCVRMPASEDQRLVFFALPIPLSRINDLTYSTTVKHLSSFEVERIRMAWGSPDERRHIATFLNHETSKIDALVAEQQNLIALLKEKRQAVISHAVTKGLNPDVPMKDSGVEWLGEVPNAWEMRRLKAISPFITVGIVVNPSNYVSEDGYPFIYGGDICEGRIITETARRISAEDSIRNVKTMLQAGDLLTVRVGAPGVTSVVPKECEGGNCASVMLVRQGHFNSSWLCYAMNSRMVRFQVEVVQYGAAQEQFNIGHAVNFWIACPGEDEQNAIAEFLDRETARIDSLICEAEHTINLLQERRSALISAAVTGKIDVRNLARREAA